MTGRIPTELQTRVMRLLGIKDGEFNSSAAIAVQCAWDMGYRQDHALESMAREFLTPPQSQ